MVTLSPLSALLLPACWLLSSAVEEVTRTGSSAAPWPAGTLPGPGNSSGTTGTPAVRLPGLNVDSSMIQRALYVLIGITGIGVLYFLIRAVRLKRPPQKKRYGLLSNYEDSVEMEAVESDEDDTLYEARSLRR